MFDDAFRTLIRDPAYFKLFLKTGSYKTCVKAGFIPELVQDRVHQRNLGEDWFISDMWKLPPGGTILLMTGCFAPMHYGHIEAMETAKTYLTKIGKKVTGGFFSPCHRQYVYQKTRSMFHSVGGRSFRMKKELEKTPHSWIEPCNYEIDAEGPLNFTSVYRAFVKHFDDQEVVLVYGSDNRNFRLTMLNNELNICVGRTGEHERPDAAPKIKTNTIYLKGGQYRAWSSTMVRDYHASSSMKAIA